jgi:hypothetical protein
MQSVPSLNDIPQGQIYTLILYAKKELYFALATRAAPKVDIGADNNNYLKQDQRFKHYMTLIAAVDEELRDSVINTDGGGGTGGVVMTYDTTLPERYFTKYNRDKRPVPKVNIKIINIADDIIEFSWVTSYISKFYSYRVWVSENNILDLFSSDSISKEARKVFETDNPHKNHFRVDGVDMTKPYYIAVGVTSMEGNTGYSQFVYEPPEIDDETGGDTP